MDGLGEVAGIDDGHHAGRQFEEIFRTPGLFQGRIMLEVMLQGQRAGDLALVDQLNRGLVNTAVHGLVEMVGLQELADHLIGAVVAEKSADQRRLRFHVVRRGSIGRKVLGTAVDRSEAGVGCLGCHDPEPTQGGRRKERAMACE